MIIDTKIQGIPCQVELTYHKPHRGEREKGSGVQLEPDEAAGLEIIEILNASGKGKHMQWLEDKMTDDDEERIYQLGWDAMVDEEASRADFQYECMKEEKMLKEG